MSTFLSSRLPASILLLIVLCVAASFRTREKKTAPTASLAQLVSEGIIDASVTSTGGHRGECVQFALKNKTSKPVSFNIEAGRRLLSEDAGDQDILIVKSQEVRLAGGEAANVNGYGFCCQASNSSPYAGEAFEIGTSAPKSWMGVLHHIDTSRYPESTLQHAVWVLSDHHRLSSVGDAQIDSLKQLHTELAAIRGDEPMPWYQTVYAESEQRVFSDEVEAIRATVPYIFSKSGTVTIAIRDRFDHVQYLVQRQPQVAGNHEYQLSLDVTGFEPGQYTFYVYQDLQTLLTRMDFKV